MKKVFSAALLLVILSILSSCAYAAPTISVNEYECLVCDKTFYSFRGDELDKKDFLNDKKQYETVFQLYDPGRHLDQCKNGWKTHKFDRKGTKSVAPSFIVQNMPKFVSTKSGSTTNATLWTWECLVCKKTFYSFGDNLNIKSWHEQPSNIYNLKNNRPIAKCNDQYILGHVFKLKSMTSVSSAKIASVLNDLYYVK